MWGGGGVKSYTVWDFFFFSSDTAGLREAVDPVEQEGVRRALIRCVCVCVLSTCVCVSGGESMCVETCTLCLELLLPT